MSKLRMYGVIVLALLTLTGMLHAQEPQDQVVMVSYQGITFSYVPEAFGALLPAYDEGTPYQRDAPYFANIAPHISFKFMRPDPIWPDVDWTGELRVYRLTDLETYPEPTYQTVVDQLRNLDTANLSAHVNAGPEARDPGLPFMPVLNATQVFWTHPEAQTSEAAAGIGYYVYYSVIPDPILEGQILYAYQAISTDSAYYISFSMPVETGLLETTMPDNLDRGAFVEAYIPYLQGIFDTINNADPATFKPTPDELTRFIASIAFVEQEGR
jgi:hypothetical protein